MRHFRQKAARHAASDDGIEIKFVGLEKLVYSENAPSGERRSVTVTFETLLGRVNYDLFVNEKWLQHWDSPHQEHAINESERSRIVTNITEALDFLRLTYTLS
jgi:hypothetical protein